MQGVSKKRGQHLSIISAAGFRKKKNKHKHSSTVRENYYKLTSGRSTELKLWSISWEFNRQTNKFGLSTVYSEFEAKFSGEKRRFRR